MHKVRVDVLLVARGLAESQDQAQRLVMAGQVRADGQLVPKPGSLVLKDSRLEVDPGPRFVSRGGEKLEAALGAFAVDVAGRICADVGASTGGFTDCLLQHGAARVYAIDVGHGILHWQLRQDSRVVVMERTNARYVDRLPEPVSLVTVDASFISLKILLPVVKMWFSPPKNSLMSEEGSDFEARDATGSVIALIKPQFEAGREAVSRGAGVLRDPQIHRDVLLEVLSFAQAEGYEVAGLIRSPLPGAKGNMEFLVRLNYPGITSTSINSLLSPLF